MKSFARSLIRSKLWLALLAFACVGGSHFVSDAQGPVVGGLVTVRLQDGAGNALTSAARGSERALSVQVVDGSGNQITSFSGSGVSHIDDAAFTPATDDISPIGIMFDDVSPDTLNEGDAGIPRGASNRVPYQIIRDGAGNERGANVDASGNLMVNLGVRIDATNDSIQLGEGSVLNDVLDLTNSNPITVAIVDGSGSQITSFGGGVQYNEADTDSTITGTAMLWEDTSDTLRAVSAAKPLPVNIISGAGSGGTASQDDSAFTIASGNGTPVMGVVTSDTVDSGDVGVVAMTESRSLNINLAHLGGNAILTGGANGSLAVGGVAAHDASATGINPILNGLFAVAHGSDPTAVAADDLVRWVANRDGVPFTIGGHPNVQTVEYLATTAQTNDAIVTVSAGAKIVVTHVQVLVDEATTVGVAVRIGFGASTLATLPTDGNTATGILVSHAGAIPGGGLNKGDGNGILGIGADDEDLRITCEAATSGALRVVVSYYTVDS